MGEMLLDLRLGDVVPAGVGVGAVESAARGLGVPDRQVGRLGAVVGELIREARAREAFGDQPDSIRIEVRLFGHRLVVRVTDDRMPVLGDAAADQASFRLSHLAFVDDLRLSLETGGNVAECAIRIPEDASWLGPEPIVAGDAARFDDATAAGVVFRARDRVEAVAAGTAPR